MCSNDLELLKVWERDLHNQFSIATDLLDEVCKKFTAPYQHQCVLNAVRVIVAIISNRQKLMAVLTNGGQICKEDLHRFHNDVISDVYRIIGHLKPWLSIVMPVTMYDTERAAQRELEVSH